MHVLVIDDEDALLNFLGEVLREEGFRVSLTRSGKEAVITAQGASKSTSCSWPRTCPT